LKQFFHHKKNGILRFRNLNLESTVSNRVTR
jgi:hypothetical protein